MLSFGSVAAKIFGSSNDRRVKGFRGKVDAINALEPEIEALSDEELRERTVEFRRQVAEGATLDSILAPAFATVREAARRSLKQRHFDVQMIGGMVLHQGNIAEMKTGEGKTLVATLAVYLNALASKGVHVVTVNDYLAKRDSEWMGQVYRFLGLTVGVIVHGLNDEERKAAYACDVTYATNNELGFDYLRDNMKMSRDEMVQRGHSFAIVDEVDSILIDEARTPLIISGPLEDRADLYLAIDALIPKLEKEDFELDEKQRQVSLTEAGNDTMERLLGEAGLLKGSLYDIENVTIVHHVNQGLKAHKLFQRDKDYIVKASEVVIIDEFTGRMMPGRRYSEGLHQALEAKERVEIQPENQTLASITFQNYFRLYEKLAGMTGTANTEASEFMDIYGLDVIEIPTNLDVSRVDEDDEIYRTQKEKYAAIITTIADCYRRGQPVLVGTTSIEKSEQLAELLKDRKYIQELGRKARDYAEKLSAKESEIKTFLEDIGLYLMEVGAKAKNSDPIPHQVLNARFHEQEASIIAQAGKPSGVTIATNMAGRGTDIQLGGNVEYQLRDWIIEQGETRRTMLPSPSAASRSTARCRCRSRRRWRPAVSTSSARNGTRAAVSTTSCAAVRAVRAIRAARNSTSRSTTILMRIFGSERMDSVLKTLGLQEGEAITHPWMNKSLEMAQKKVEARNFDIRKQILKYDDVMNDQRKVIFDQRIDIMGQDDVSETVADLRQQVVRELVTRFIPEKAYAEQWDTKGLKEAVDNIFDIDLPIDTWGQEEGIANVEMEERLIKAADDRAAQKAQEIGPELYGHIEKEVLLRTLDMLWREHLVTLEHLRQVIGFRAYGQRDPLNEYKTEAFVLFESLLGRLREGTTGQLMHIELAPAEEQPMLQPVQLPEMEAHHIDPTTGLDEFEMADAAIAQAGRRAPGQIDRREPAVTRKATDGGVDPKQPSTWGKVSRNALCPCGSGKKYKHCHGKHD